MIDADHDQPSAGGAVVGAVSIRRRRRRRRRFRGQRNPFSGDDAALSTIDPDVEIGGRQAGNRLTVIVDDRDVERPDFDRRLEARFGRLRLLIADDGPAEAGHDRGRDDRRSADPTRQTRPTCLTCLSCLTHYFPAMARYPCRERTSWWPSTSTLILRH